jgi:phosphomannomutase
MITASHNEKEDNGVKIIECNGQMLAQEEEPLAEKYVNSQNIFAFLKELNSEDLKEGNTMFRYSETSEVWVGMDTRETSE